ncbi:uncharacterized protein LOC132269527 [Cornus florida]|uniref:uncharacterized protein LOC132269527 n=1 Tax=Cornus florida TaxID=4283 RepID=UPI00289AD2AD|nr:uncharacterized protein LOC132269527 [Cornus florida]
MKAKQSNTKGFSLRSILIHSLWITILGALLFRFATANTQQLIYVEIFAIAGTILATAPWIIQLLLSFVIILSHNAGICDLTWLIGPPCKEGSTAMDEDIEDGRGLIPIYGRNRVANGFGSNLLVPVEGRNGPQLQRSNTV